MEILMTKIAVVTDDHQTISAHFGRAVYYDVFTVEDGKVVEREMRAKPGHNQFAGEPHGEQGHVHGQGPESEGRHARMMGVISDCQILIARGMGMGAYDGLNRMGIHPILTDIQEIEAAIKVYLDGQLTDHPERVH
jgi:predicted Fe-Mo cluster-binding NifX family protein